jgi:hypothetical protein
LIILNVRDYEKRKLGDSQTLVERLQILAECSDFFIVQIIGIDTMFSGWKICVFVI